MNKVKAMRIMAGKNQIEMSELLNMSVSSYRKKENGIIAFNDSEKKEFIEIEKRLKKIDKEIVKLTEKITKLEVEKNSLEQKL